LVTSGSHVTTTKEQMRGQPGMRRTYLRSVPLPDRASSGHMTLSLPVKRPHKGRYGTTSGCACAEHTSGHGIFRSRDFVTSGQKAPLGRSKLRIRRTYFRTGLLPDRDSSGHMTLSLRSKRPHYVGYAATFGCTYAEHISGQDT
jgi:hypothetical protein